MDNNPSTNQPPTYQPQPINPAPQPVTPPLGSPEPVAQAAPPEPNKPRKLKWTYLLIVFLAIIILALLGFIYMNKNKTVAPAPTPKSEQTPTSTPTPEASNSADMSNWKTYNSSLERGLTFQYPSDWKVKESKDSTSEIITLTTPSGFEFFFTSSLLNPDGGCDNCRVTYLEKVDVPNYKPLLIAEGNGASGNVIYLSDSDLKMGDSRLDWEIASKNDPDTRLYVFKGMFNDPGNNMTMTEFADSSEVQTTKQILRTVKYIN